MTSQSPPSIAESLIPGKTRIRDADGFVATVRYVGPVASAKKSQEIYAGVEWDDSTRGKHDGSVISRTTNEIVRHFSLEYASPTGGSFLRLNKLDLGVELSMALIRSRYVTPDAELVAPNNVLPYSARTSSGREKPIEFLGEMKVRKRQQLEDLKDISLRSMGISCVVQSDPGLRELKDTFEHLTDLDVAGNLFSDWDAMLDILQMFPKMEWLSFASNKIYDLQPAINKCALFPQLRVLNVNKCSIASFRTIEKLDEMFPNLEELCVAYSDLSDMNMEPDLNNEGADDTDEKCLEPLNGFRRLKLLDCSNCKLQHWNLQVRRLSQIPQLETLILDDNPLSEVSISNLSPSDCDKMEFASLTNLQIAGTKIDQWSGIESIAYLPKLTTLRFRKSPLTDEIGSGESRAGTISRVPQIEVLNASTISLKERLEAERRYVSAVSREMILLSAKLKQNQSVENNTTCNGDANSNENDDKICAILKSFHELGLEEKYAIFPSLLSKHKESMLVSQPTSLSGGTISQNALNVTIRSMAAESCTMNPLQKRLPGSLKIGRLKMMCTRAFGLEVELQILHFRGEVSDIV